MFKYFYNFIDKIKAKLNQKGQGMVEYALIIAFVAAIAAVALKSQLGTAVSGAFEKAANAITTAGETTPASTNP